MPEGENGCTDGRLFPMPARIFQREIYGGGGQRTKSLIQMDPFPHFVDAKTFAMNSLEWIPGQSQNVHTLSSPTGPAPIYSLAKTPNSSRLLVGDEAGNVHFMEQWFNPVLHNLDSTPVPVARIPITERSAILSVKGFRDKILAGTGSGYVCVLDVEGSQLLRSFEGHSKAVKKVDSFDGGDVIVSCGKDNKICVYDLRAKDSHNPINFVREAHSLSSGGGCGPRLISDASNKRTSPRASPRGRRTVQRRPKPGVNVATSLSSSVTDVVFLDEHRLISAGSSDGRLKEWDLRLSYKHLTKCHPVQIVEYPNQSNVRGYSCLHLAGSKLFASSVHYEIFQLDIATMICEATFLSPSKISNFTKIDVSADGNYLACGCDESLVHIFSTKPRVYQKMKREPDDHEKPNESIKPFKCLDHGPINLGAVCCPLFSPFDDLMLTTGGDASIVSKWSPSIYLTSSRELEKEATKKELEQGPIPPIKTEFHSLSLKKCQTSSPKKCTNVSDKENEIRLERLLPSGRERVCFAKLDSFPNYVVDGMKLPHVCPTRKIKLKPKIGTIFKYFKAV